MWARFPHSTINNPECSLLYRKICFCFYSQISIGLLLLCINYCYTDFLDLDEWQYLQSISEENGEQLCIKVRTNMVDVLYLLWVERAEWYWLQYGILLFNEGKC